MKKVVTAPRCAGCGKKFKKKEGGCVIYGTDMIARYTHVGECHTKVWNGFIYERDNRFASPDIRGLDKLRRKQ